MTTDSTTTQVAARLAPFGSTIFTEISRMAAERGAINLGQGFPNFDGPDFVKEAAIEAIRAGHGQYAPSAGVPDLNRGPNHSLRKASAGFIRAARKAGMRPARVVRIRALREITTKSLIA